MAPNHVVPNHVPASREKQGGDRIRGEGWDEILVGFWGFIYYVGHPVHPGGDVYNRNKPNFAIPSVSISRLDAE